MNKKGMTKEYIESIRRIVLPFIAKKLKEIDYEGLGESDAKEFTKDFNEILELADKALEQKIDHWIPVKFRPLTDEEQEEYPDYCYMADCLMPDDGEEILVSTKYGRVEKDECRFDDGYYLDSGYDWQTDIVAWMPLPESYKGVDEVKKT